MPWVCVHVCSCCLTLGGLVHPSSFLMLVRPCDRQGRQHNVYLPQRKGNKRAWGPPRVTGEDGICTWTWSSPPLHYLSLVTCHLLLHQQSGEPSQEGPSILRTGALSCTVILSRCRVPVGGLSVFHFTLPRSSSWTERRGHVHTAGW